MACPRRLAPLVFIGLAGVVGVLSFADRAPGLSYRSFQAGVRVSNAFEDATGLTLIGGRDLPYSFDLVGHFVLWAMVAVVGWWAFGRRIHAVALALVLFVASYAVEVGQSHLSSTRTPDLHDLVANGLGIVAGTMAAVLVDRTVRLLRRPNRVR